MFRTILLILITFSLQAQQSADSLNQVDGQGRKQGKWTKKFQGMEITRYEGQFKDDKPYGTFRYYYTTGDIRTKLSYQNADRAFAENYYPDGKIMAKGIYEKEEKDSTWLYYSVYGEKIAEEYYVKGKRYGNFKKYHRSGELLEERYFENDMENGPMIQYFANGMKSREVTFVNGSIEGHGVYYHENGMVRFEGDYMKDTKHGMWRKYDEQGNLIDERMYTKGVPEERDSDLLMYDTTQFKRKDMLEMSDFIEEDYMAIPEDDGKKKRKK